MSLFQRAATLAALAFALAGLVGASTPGFAVELDKTLNVSPPPSVPSPPLIAAPELPTADVQPEDAPPAPMPQPALQMIQDIPARAALDDADYASLAAAVAAQVMPADPDRELACLAGAIYFESKGEPLAGQLAVAEVILNRMQSGRFAKSVCSVVTQRGQFSFVRGGRIPSIPLNAHYRTAVAIARVAINDIWESPAPKALFFHARRVAPGWRMQKVASIGNHIFYR